MIHIHFFNKIGHWKGSWGLKLCRCGQTKLFDLWGFQFQHTPEQKAVITKRLLIEAGRG